MYYVIIWFIIAAAAGLYFSYPNKKIQYALYALCYTALVFTAGLRYETGTDWFAYAGVYNRTPDLAGFSPFGNDMEAGYIFLNSLFRTIGADVNILFLFISVITTFILFRSFQAYIPRQFFFVGILVYYSTLYLGLDMSGVRQAIAATVFLFALRYVFRPCFWRYGLCILVAALFHQSALLLLAVYPLLKMRIHPVVLFSLLGIGMVIFIVKIEWLHTLLSALAALFTDESLVARRLTAYTSTEIFLRPRPFSPVIPFYVALFILAFIMRRRLSLRTPYFNIIFNLFFLFVLSLFYLYESLDISFRFGCYFMLAYPLLLPLALSVTASRRHTLVAFAAICIVSIYTMRGVFLETDRQMTMYRPYQNYVLIKMGLQHRDANRSAPVPLPKSPNP